MQPVKWELKQKPKGDASAAKRGRGRPWPGEGADAMKGVCQPPGMLGVFEVMEFTVGEAKLLVWALCGAKDRSH